MKLRLRLNDHQLSVLAGPIDDLLARAVTHVAGRQGIRPPAREGSTEDGTIVQAGTAAAVRLGRGDTLRIEQVVEGQCADLNAFVLDDTRRPFSAARTRMLHGLRPTTGAVLWSAPPELPMLRIVADTAGGHDLGFPMCTEAEYGIPGHANCFDIQKEAQAEWGLTPHDPLNLWLPSEVLADGQLRSWPVACRRGDYIELRADIDVLVVVNPCPDDLFGSSQYEPGPVRVATSSSAPPEIAGRPLSTRWHEIEVELPDSLAARLAGVRDSGWFGTSDAAVARALVLRWWEAQSVASTQMADQGQPTSQLSPTDSD